MIRMGLDTVLSTKWTALFENAVDAYTKALYWADQESHARETAAIVFHDLISQFHADQSEALDVLKESLRGEDVIRRNTAARLLVELSAPEAIACLIADLDRHTVPPLETTVLKQLNLESPHREVIWRELQNFTPFEQVAILESLLRNPNDVALKFIMQKIIDGDSSMTNNVIVKALARWGRDDLLWRITNGHPASVNQNIPYWLMADMRLEAAFYLGLGGDQNAVDFLQAIAEGSDSMQAAQAVIRLAWLACPGAIAPIKALLIGTDVYAMGMALNATSVLSCAALGPTLLELASRLAPSEPGFGTPPLSDEAIRVLGKMTGQALPEHIVEYSVGIIPDTFTEATRLKAVSYFSEAIQKLNPAWRFYHGELITLTHLVGDLLSPHDGPKRTAAYNLRAITGEDYGYDPDLDLIANLPAIAAWRARAKRVDPLKTSGWAFAGVPIPGPKL